MCSVNDGSELMPSETRLDNVTHCKKCEELAVVVVQIRHAYCRDCFLAMVTHKFRAVLGKSKLMNIKDHVAAVYLGNATSVALLHLLRAGLSETSHKRFLFCASVIYIDEGVTQDKSIETRKRDLKSAASFITSQEFNAFYTKLEDVLEDNKKNICLPLNMESELSVNEATIAKLQDALNNANSVSARQDMLVCLRHKLILQAAKEISANKVFVDSCGTDLAVQIMSDVALGRGIHLPHNVGFCDARDPDVKILRPMRDLARKEVAYYNQFMNLEVSIIAFNTKAGPYASIQNLSEHFILDLQENFPSTVSTVFRTGEKLSGSNKKPAESGEDNCAMCDAVLDTSTELCSSLEATKFSRTISSLGPKGFDNLQMKAKDAAKPLKGSESCACNSENGKSGEYLLGCCSTSKSQHFPEDVILSCLCYGCQLIFRDLDSPNSLPAHVLQAVQERSNLRKMRATLQDFLL